MSTSTDATCYHTDNINEDSVRIRLMSELDLGIDFSSRKLTIPTNLGPLRAQIEKVIVHFHGGGFIALNSDNHQIFLRRWAKEL